MMKSTTAWWWVAAALVLLPVAVLVEADEERNSDEASLRGPNVAPVQDERYRAACGECHLAYQPGLLPARSWNALMGGLSDHFGDNAELPAEEVAAISAYLQANAADAVASPASRELAGRQSANTATLLRITELPGFKREHREIPARLIKDNDKVRSLSQCQACHQKADAGYYNEHTVDIPGAGRWED